MTHRLTKWRAALCALSLLTLYPTTTPVFAQQSLSIDRRSLDAYAITDARIVTLAGGGSGGAGAIIERGTLVVRNGLIENVGANISAPPDARVIDGTGLTIYPGLIDADTTLGVTPAGAGGARGATTPAAVTPGAPPAASATPSPSRDALVPVGIRPEIMASDLLQPGGANADAARNAGVTAALSVPPRDGVMMGQSALISLAGDSAQEMIVRSPVALHVGFGPRVERGGSYPASLMGVFAALRQTLLDARRYREINAAYERDPRGARRPPQDQSLVALGPVVTRQRPVVMYADSEREIRRALDLAEEFNLQAIIAGGLESWKVADRLKQMNVPILLSLNYPKRVTAQVPEADPDSLRTLRERADAPKVAARLQAAGVRFAFQSGAMTNIADFVPNVAKAVENGLSREEAVRALTLRPAEIFGVGDRLGSIERGKIANLTVTRGDLFDRNAKVIHVFIDGRPVDLRPATAAPAAGGAAAPPTAATVASPAIGTWSVKIAAEDGERSATLTLQQQGGQLSGALQGDLGSAQIAGGAVSAAGEIRFSAPVQLGGQTVEATFAGNVANNEMRGTVQIVGRQPASFTGTRAGGPNNGGTPR